MKNPAPQQRSSSIFDVEQKSVAQLQQETTDRIALTRERLNMGRATSNPCPAPFGIVPKTIAARQAEAAALSAARSRYEAFLSRSNAGQKSPAHPLPYGPISVEAWKQILSPEQMSRYAFTAYNSLLSLTALETIQNHDFATEGVFGRELATYENLREAMRTGYESGTVDIRCWGGRLSLEFYVPGGGLTHWPVHIPRPAQAAAPQPQDQEQNPDDEDQDDDGPQRLWGAVEELPHP